MGKDSQGQFAYGRVLYGASNVILDGTMTLALAQAKGTGQSPLTATELNGQSITMLSARDASVTGTILPSIYTPQIDVSDMPALLTWRLVDLQTNNHPDLTLQADLLPVTSLRNTTGVKTNRGSGLNLLVAAVSQNVSSPVAAALNTVTNAQLAASGGATGGASGAAAQQNSWHPEPYSSYIATGLANIAHLRNTVFEQALLTDPSGTRAWADAAGFRGSIDGQGDLGGYRYRMSQLAVGKDMGDVLGGAWGGYFAATDQKIDEHDLLTQKISGTTLGVGAYWRQKGQTWTTLAQMGVARGDHDSSRQLSVGAYSGAARSRYNSQSLQAALRFSAPWFEFRGMEVSKELGGSISLYRQSGFDETGDDQFGFRIKSANAAAYIAHAGAHVRFPLLMGTVGLRPVATARLEHDFARNKDHGIEASLLANPGTYEEFVGQGRGANSAVLGLGLMSETLGPWQVQAGLNHAWHSHGRDWGAGIKVRYSW